MSAPYHGKFVFQLHYHQLNLVELMMSKGFEELELHYQFLAVKKTHVLDFVYIPAESVLLL